MDWTKDRAYSKDTFRVVIYRDGEINNTPDKIVWHYWMMTRFWIKRHNKFFDDYDVINGHWAKRYIRDCRGMWWDEMSWPFLLCWHFTYPAMKEVSSYPHNNMECGQNTHHGRWHILTNVMWCSGKSCARQALHASWQSWPLFIFHK